MAVELKLNRHI